MMSNLEPGFYKIENVVNGIIGDGGDTGESSPIIKVKDRHGAGIFSIVHAPAHHIPPGRGNPPASKDERWLITWVGTMKGYAPVARDIVGDNLIWGRIPGDIEPMSCEIGGDYNNSVFIRYPYQSASLGFRRIDLYWVLPSSELGTQVECKTLDVDVGTKSIDNIDDSALWILTRIEPIHALKSGLYYINNLKNGPIDAIKATDKTPGTNDDRVLVVASSESAVWEITKVTDISRKELPGLVYNITYLGGFGNGLSGRSAVYDSGKLYLDDGRSHENREQWLIHPLLTHDVFTISRDNHTAALGPIHWSLGPPKDASSTTPTGIMQVSVLHEHQPNSSDTHPSDAGDTSTGEAANNNPDDCFWEIIPFKPKRLFH